MLDLLEYQISNYLQTSDVPQADSTIFMQHKNTALFCSISFASTSY